VPPRPVHLHPQQHRDKGGTHITARLIADTFTPGHRPQARIDLSETPAKLAALDQQPGNGITIISRTPLAP